MNLCVTSDIIGSNAPFTQALAFLKKAGFEEIDFSITSRDMLRADWKEAARLKFMQARDEGVRIRYVHLPFDYPGAQDGWAGFYEASCRAIDMAVESGADCAAIHPRTSMTREYDAAIEHERAVEFLAPYCVYAKQAGLALALENMRGPGRSAPKGIRRYGTQVGELIRMADETGIGVCWDTGHGNISGQKQRESLALIGHRLRMIHVNDNFAEGDVHIAPFLGSVDWSGVAAGLKEAGYVGSINLEVEVGHLPGELQGIHAQYMAAAARKLAAMIG